ncbi:MAG: iron response transcriptional regulator IrrA [Pseudomonadota bacterium]
MQINMCEAINRLRNAGLRPTRQRLSLATMLFAGPDRHISAEELHEEAVAANVPVSLATVYNTLNQFTEAGLLREVAIDGTKSYYDTNTSNHYHFYLESENRLIDIDSNDLRVVGLPEAPDGTKVSRIDVVVRLSDK